MVLDAVFAGVARQLGRPSGPVGRVVGRALDRSNRSLVEAAVESASLSAGSIAADVGFGGGVGLELLLGRVGPTGAVHGVEISEAMLAAARRRFKEQLVDGRLRLHAGSMTGLPLPERSVDAVVSTNTIYFVSDLGAALVELARVLRPGARLVLGVGDPDAMARMPFTKHGFMLRPVGDIVDHAHRAGFATVEARRVDGDVAAHLIVCDTRSALSPGPS